MKTEKLSCKIYNSDLVGLCLLADMLAKLIVNHTIFLFFLIIFLLISSSPLYLLHIFFILQYFKKIMCSRDQMKKIKFET